MEIEIFKLATETANQVENDQQLPEKYRIEAFKLLLQYKLGLGAGPAVKMPPSSVTLIGEEITFSEFLNQIEEPNTNPQKFAAIAYYYESSRRESSITQDDIMATMTEAGLITPKNFGRDVRTATSSKNALLMVADPKDGKAAWRLTRTGRSFIEQRIKKT